MPQSSVDNFCSTIETDLKVIFTNFNFYQISRKGRKRILLNSVGDNGEYRNITI